MEKQETRVSEKLGENEEYLRRCCCQCDDIIISPMWLGKEKKIRAFLIYVEATVSNVTLED